MSFLIDVCMGNAIDPTRAPVSNTYPTLAEVQFALDGVVSYGDLTVLRNSKTLKDFLESCPDCKQLKLTNSLFYALHAPVYITGASPELVDNICKIYSATKCANDIVFKLSKGTIDKLCTFGYLQNGVTLESIIRALVGKCWMPNAVPNFASTRSDGVKELCIREGVYVPLPSDVFFKYMSGEGRIAGNTVVVGGKIYGH